MAGQYRKLVTIVLVLSISILCIACNLRSADEVIGDAASSYAIDKPTENFTFIDSDAVIDEQIDRFVGSYYRPEEKELTDDEYIDLMRKLFDPDFDLDTDATDPTQTSESDPTKNTDETKPTDQSQTDPTDTSETTTAVITPIGNTVSSMDDLERVMHSAFDKTETKVDFEFTDGYYVDLGDCINDVYASIQRVDPIDASGVKEWQWWYRGNSYTLFITYYFDVDELKKMKKETSELVENAVNQIQPAGKTEYEVVNAVNEYLCDNVYYPPQEPYEPVTHTAYGALKNGCAVCEGYACAASLMLSKCGIECDIEIGECNDGGLHAWNLVKVENKWYQLDVCWNDGGGPRDEFLLVDDEYMHQSRDWDASKYPVCDKKYAAKIA